ncbi:PadR family transcriptional regulator [Streptomyces sp. BP-8]|uniref:PadR family transcriptional regulator n=1 Tax=Streptomyces sirii TaxID=3127701 RepID=A0ABZ2QHX6_9ACTN
MRPSGSFGPQAVRPAPFAGQEGAHVRSASPSGSPNQAVPASAGSLRGSEAGLDVADGAIYPALARLRKRRLVEVERRAGEGGPARTCYKPGPAGLQMLRSWSSDGNEFAAGIGSIVTHTAEKEP